MEFRVALTSPSPSRQPMRWSSLKPAPVRSTPWYFCWASVRGTGGAATSALAVLFDDFFDAILKSLFLCLSLCLSLSLSPVLLSRLFQGGRNRNLVTELLQRQGSAAAEDALSSLLSLFVSERESESERERRRVFFLPPSAGSTSLTSNRTKPGHSFSRLGLSASSPSLACARQRSEGT